MALEKSRFNIKINEKSEYFILISSTISTLHWNIVEFFCIFHRLFFYIETHTNFLNIFSCQSNNPQVPHSLWNLYYKERNYGSPTKLPNVVTTLYWIILLLFIIARTEFPWRNIFERIYGQCFFPSKLAIIEYSHIWT